MKHMSRLSGDQRDTRRRLVRASQGLRKLIRISKDNLSVESTHSKYVALGGDADSTDGLSPSCCIIDELHAHMDRTCTTCSIPPPAPDRAAGRQPQAGPPEQPGAELVHLQRRGADGPGGNVKPNRERSGEKIDGAVAMAMAIGRIIARPPEPFF